MSNMKNKNETFSAVVANNSSVFKLVLFVVFIVLFFGSILYKIILVPNGPVHEFDDHILFAVRMAQEERVVLPHFLFQLLTIFNHHLLKVFNLPAYQIIDANVVNQTINYDWGVAALFVMLEIYIAIGLLLFYHFKFRFVGNIKSHENVAYFVAFGVSICAPVFLLAPVDGKFYLGYITPSTIYIIPTQILLKLPSLGLFLLGPFFFKKYDGYTKLLISIALLVLLSGLAKPNYLLIMLPALGVMAMVAIFRNHYVNWWALAVALISSAFVLGWQYYFKFINLDSPIYKSEIILTSPFEVWGWYSDFIFYKIILSVLFPLFVTVLFWRDFKQDFLLQFGWALFSFGLIYTGFVGESGDGKFAGNFVWCGQIGCFMLFVSAASMFFSKFTIYFYENKARVLVGVALFCAHVVCGLIYYFRSFNSSFV